MSSPSRAGSFDEVRSERFILVVSDLVLEELSLAPANVRSVLADLPASAIDAVTSSEESAELKQAYLDAGVVGPASANDAAHIALATVFGVELVVSWNFKHIVHFEKIAGFEGVNSLRGYRSPRIYSPREVVTD
jgi:hypothetical protein